MRILHVIAGCDRAEGGPIEGVFRLGEAFRAMGHSQELLTLDSPDAAAIAASPVPVHAMGRPAVVGNSPVSRVRRWARRSPDAVSWLGRHAADYDAIIVDGLWNYATRVARLKLPSGSVPYVVFPHGMLDPWFRKQYPVKHAVKSLLWRFNEGPLLKQARAVAFTTTQERNLARKTWSPWRIRDEIVGFGTAAPPVRNPAMEHAFAEAVPSVMGAPYLLFLSRLHEKKNCEALLKAFGSIAGQVDFDLVMAGPGQPSYADSLRSLAQNVAPEGRIHWPGMLTGDAKWGALYGCEAMALTSHQENFGVVVAEALACGRPVIISDQVNIHDEVSAGQAGLVCEDTVEGAREALLEFSRLSPGARDAMGERGRVLFAESFEIGATAARLIEIFAAAPDLRVG